MAHSGCACARDAQLSTLPNPSVTVVIPVYRDATRAADAARTMCEQRLPNDLAAQVIVVDDGSGDGTYEYLQSLQLPGVDLISLPDNLGRSGARNAGAQVALGEVIVFMDCDCLPVESDWLSAHYAAYRDPAVVAATGNVIGCDGGFWSRFQAEASNRRRRQHARGQVFSGSSQNLSVRKGAFSLVDGFDIGYTEYGFEDRDLLLRLSKLGSVAWVSGATVVHRDILDMGSIAKKMRLAGGKSAERFSQRHPAAYRELSYAFFDARIHHFWRVMRRPLVALVPRFALALQSAISARALPFVIAKMLVRVVTGLAFATGSLDSPDSSAKG